MPSFCLHCNNQEYIIFQYMKKRNVALPDWDLSDLYSSIDDPKIDAALATALKRAGMFEKNYRGKIDDKSDSKQILKAVTEYERILVESNKPGCYAYLEYSVDSVNPRNAALLQKTKKKSIEINQRILFFELALINLSEQKLKHLISDPELKNYKHFLQKILKQKPHRLTEAEEKIFNDKYLTSGSALNRLFDEELAEQKYEFKKKGKIVLLNESEILDYLHSPDGQERKLAAQSFTKGIKSISRRLTFVTNMLAEDKSISDKYFKYTRPEDSRHLDNETTKETVDTMINVVVKNYSLVQEYYQLKKKILKLKNIYDYDRYAPLSVSKKKYDYSEAKDIILDAFESFSPKFAHLANDFFEKKWIHAKPEKNKRSGAYCMYVSPELHPYVFLNYNYSIDDIETLAHELGHGVHASLARKQTYLNFDWPLTVAETASVFGEMILFDHLKEKLPDRERFSLLLRRIESTFATVFRQTAMFLFERDLHEARKNGEMTSETISALWRKRQAEMFGRSVALTPDYDLWWSYIPHFKHTPFYVYAYAFGELLSLSLYAKYKKEGKSFVSKYITLLKNGGLKSPDDLLEPFKIKLSDPEFWMGGVEIIRSLVVEAEKIYSSRLH
ncbi:MAG: PepF/M3 family oligoendopeptidase [Candidatus Yanofskybacteria bacterium GW2011_GWA2_44_10]|uniref:PepF/M3 family oligoendopeptidase n=2 Tax=Candidatus Yanofskyibacteriota TaxID=1752733 RepID=A0A0G1P1X5_9BACT|nr:MAG: PepF/M3 family oligoendopeptidase [Candidatus Yanofskybacteria bacterium GW2011_GWA2_44_10]KKT90379.1 MAG: PepF/M3 family oligoendopeptidase [Candidatus Yanofskybacteria bacterium GW2011_GWB1_45_11]